MVSRRQALIGAGATTASLWAASLSPTRLWAASPKPPGKIPPLHTISGVATGITAFVGYAARGPVGKPVALPGWAAFAAHFGDLDTDLPPTYAVHDFFANGGTRAVILRLPGKASGAPDYAATLRRLDTVDLINLLCLLPPSADSDIDPAFYQAAETYCQGRRAFLIVDPPLAWTSAATAQAGLAGLGLAQAENAAIYFPRLELSSAQKGKGNHFAPCGAVAGIMARTDAKSGVWKAPSGTSAVLTGVTGLTTLVSDKDDAALTDIGINCLRTFPVQGPIVYGARTAAGSDQQGDVYRYIPVRRTAMFIEESLRRGTAWFAFAANSEANWAQVRLSAGTFLEGLFVKGAFQGTTPQQAFFVKCDSETTTQTDIDNGIANLVVGFAPLRPAEFVVIQIQMTAALN